MLPSILLQVDIGTLVVCARSNLHHFLEKIILTGLLLSDIKNIYKRVYSF